ncbi:Protein LAS1 [Frankliniella fusca]|uniref:Protein LAS1 n=1 Tax=Frankliniella fusca TaxID=407009 RepID=A0AAE1H271_9NEOP|nr:Protein LAS1 [Frankliniella fusca]
MKGLPENMDSTVYKRIVPWFSMDEWKLVYNLVYSECQEDQKCGLDHLIGWKARCRSLPPAVECTFCIFQVLTGDPHHLSEKCLSAATEQQLRLMYSTAVMRFLNLMLEVPNQEDLGGTMYSKAERLGIPEWIVNLRHDAAHGVSLPDLSLLRAASVFIAKWLNEHYWEQESLIVSDWHVTQNEIFTLSAEESELRDIIESWEALSLYNIAGFENMSQIPDNDLKSSVKSIHEMLRKGDRQETEVKVSRAKVSTALSLILRKLVRFFKSRSGTIDKATLLADIVIGGDFFLPSESLMQILKSDEIEQQDVLLELPLQLTTCCSDLLNTLWTLGAIPALSCKLISVSTNRNETDLRRNVAALWVQKILASCIKVREARKVRLAIRDNLDYKAIAQHYKPSLPGSNRNAILTSLAFAAVENQRPDLKKGYSWKILQIPSVFTQVEKARQAVFPPSKFSKFFIACAVELVTPPMPIKSRMLLFDLINNHSDEKSVEEQFCDGSILSCKELPNGNVNTHGDELLPSVTAEDQKKSPWSLSPGHLEWDKCPLGVLPWQREKVKYCAVPEALLLGNWINHSKVEDCSTRGKCDDEVPSIHHVKVGRVTKHYLKVNTPKKVLKSRSASPNQRAIKFVSSLYQNSFIRKKL